MSYTIRAMTIKDKASVIEMMRTFYASPAVLSNGSEEIFCNDAGNGDDGDNGLWGRNA